MLASCTLSIQEGQLFMDSRITRWAAVVALTVAILGAGVAHAAPAGSPRTIHAAHRPRLTLLHGQVLGVTANVFQLQPVHTMPLSVTVGLSTTITVAGMPGTITDIQNGRFVNVAGRYDVTQQTFDATHINVVVPLMTGRVTAVDGATFTLRSGRGEIFQVTTTPSTQILALPMGRHRVRPGSGNQPGSGGAGNQSGPASATITVGIGDRVMVQAFPPVTGSDVVTALRLWVGTAPVPAGGTAQGAGA
jgi:hypothetical protein